MGEWQLVPLKALRCKGPACVTGGPLGASFQPEDAVLLRGPAEHEAVDDGLLVCGPAGHAGTGRLHGESRTLALEPAFIVS